MQRILGLACLVAAVTLGLLAIKESVTLVDIIFVQPVIGSYSAVSPSDLASLTQDGLTMLFVETFSSIILGAIGWRLTFDN